MIPDRGGRKGTMDNGDCHACEKIRVPLECGSVHSLTSCVWDRLTLPKKQGSVSLRSRVLQGNGDESCTAVSTSSPQGNGIQRTIARQTWAPKHHSWRARAESKMGTFFHSSTGYPISSSASHPSRCHFDSSDHPLGQPRRAW